MKNIYLVLIIFICCSCKDEKTHKSVTPTESVVILKNFKPTYQTNIGHNILLQLSGAAIEISDPNKIIKNEVNSFNSVSDTIRVHHHNNLMLVNVKFSPLVENTYYLYPGDTIVADFSNENNIKEQYTSNPKRYLEPFKIRDNDYFLSEFLFDKTALQKRKAVDSLETIKGIGELNELRKKKIIKDDYYSLRINRINYANALSQSTSDKYLKNDSLIGVTEYQNYLRQFTINKFNIKFINGKGSSYLDSKTGFDSVFKSDIYGKKAKDYLLFYFLNEMTQDFSFQDFNDRFALFKKIVSDSSLVNYINDKYLLNFNDIKNESKSTFFINSKKHKITLDELIRQNKGKVIYIDFWASWCAPCRVTMPDSRKLREKYKEKDIVFIFVSLDHDFDKWQKASFEESLFNNKNNLLAINYPKADFYKKLKMNSIPRYLIYDKQGVLQHANAPDPGNIAIVSELDKYLLKH